MRILLTRVFAIVVFVGVALSASKWEQRDPMVSAILFCFAMLLVAIASLGRLWCSLYIAGYKDKVLVTEGPYSLTRNPLYFFSFIGAIGVGLGTETLTLPIFLAVCFLLYYPAVINKEETKLAKLHPNEFSAYASAVPRFFPKNFRMSEPATYVVSPGVYRRHIISALWFIWGIGILEVLEELHELHLMPVLFTMY